MNKDINKTLMALVPILRMNGENVTNIEAVHDWYKAGDREYMKEVAEITYDNGTVRYADIGCDSNLTAIYNVIAVIQQIRPRSKAIERIERGVYSLPSAQPTQPNTPKALEALDCVSRQAAIDVEGLDEQIRCEMCRNPMHTNRGCDGNCKYDEKLYERIMQILGERIKPLPSVQQCMTATSNTMVSETVKIPVMDGTTERLPSAEPEQLEKCPIYSGVCLHPSDQCYACPRHAGAEPIIRCTNCRFFKRNIPCTGGHYNGCEMWLDDGNEIRVMTDDYCSKALPKEGEQDETD